MNNHTPLQPIRPSQSSGTSIQHEIYDLLQSLVFLLIFFIIAFTFLGRFTEVVGTSMLPTLENGDRLLIYSIGYHPTEGDIVVLKKESFLEEAIVKRIIAVGGQKVEINYNSGSILVDGVVLNETYIKERMLEPNYENNTSVTVPKGSVFVMGDNRNHSMDSRYVQLSVVDERYILGRVFCILFPFTRVGLIA